MISSPCKTCPKRNMPKEACARDCQLLQAIQDRQVVSENGTVLSGIDCTEESRYSLPASLMRTSTALWTM